MATRIQDLWPEDIQIKSVIPPHTIAQEQGKFLGKRTSNVLLGKLHLLSTLINNDNFGYKFSIYSPVIGYQYDLFRFYYSVELYPVTIEPDSDISAEMFSGQEEIIVNSEADFMEALKKIFAAEKTRKIITVMLAQTQT